MSILSQCASVLFAFLNACIGLHFVLLPVVQKDFNGAWLALSLLFCVPAISFVGWGVGLVTQEHDELIGKICCWSALLGLMSATLWGVRLAIRAGNGHMGPTAGWLVVGAVHFITAGLLIWFSVRSSSRARRKPGPP
ncbi:MAG TPA: hypothetical protein VEX38_03865 [Fimbriimonadaceae bacterium]|nr:hypothetical protein [Fimbriimonadaceae bacterium]